MGNCEKKSRQLGMPHGTACNKLRKKILFHLMWLCEIDTCFQCGEKIESVDTLSIEHKTPWLDSDDPVGLFFDMGNIAFSHLSCNCGSGTRDIKPCPSVASYNRGCRCDQCKKLYSEYKKQLRLSSTG